MRYYPLNYNEINVQAGGYNPSPIKAYNNQTFAFWTRALFQRAASTFDFDGLPENWKDTGTLDFLYYCLLKFGFVAFFDTPEFGFSFQPCGLKGYGFYYQPVQAIIANPLYRATLDIGKECEILKLTPDYFGIWDIIEYHAEKLAEIDTSINMSIVNSKLAHILGARNKNAGEALKKIYDKMQKGEPLIVFDQKLANDPADKDVPFQQFDFDVKNSYIITDLLKDQQTLIANFDKEIGIPAVPFEKKERLISSEVDTGNADTFSRSLIWIRTMEDSLKKINETFGKNIKVTQHYKQEIEENEQLQDDLVRDVQMGRTDGSKAV